MANLTPLRTFPGLTGERIHPLIISDIIYHKIIEELEDYAIILLDKTGAIQNWNKGAEKLNGYKADEIIGKNIRVFHTREDRLRNLPEELLEQAARKGKAFYEGWRQRKNGSLFWASILLTSLHEKDGAIIGFSKVTYDLSRQKESEANIVKAIIGGQEKERKEISSVLHDKVSQALASALVLLQNAGRDVRNSFILESEQYLQTALTEVKDISYRINPEAVLLSDLPTAVREYIEKIKTREKIKIRFTCVPKKMQADHDLQLFLYRVLQEQMENIVKHSGADSVIIDLRNQKKKITLSVTDDGKGFEPQKPKNRYGAGENYLHHGALPWHGPYIVLAGKGMCAENNYSCKAGDKKIIS